MDETPPLEEELPRLFKGMLDTQDSRHGDHEARLARLEAQVTAIVQAQNDLRRTVQAAITHLQQTRGETTETAIFLDLDPSENTL
jgi:hypothetical protein